MTTVLDYKPPLEELKASLKTALSLDLDDFHVDYNKTGELTSDFAGMHLESAFQAIYDVKSGDFHGHEALLRPTLGNIKEVSPDFAFTYADESDRLIKLDRVSRTLHVLNYHEIFNHHGLLFLNIHPSLLMNVNEHGKVFERILHAHAIATDRVVIEIRDFDTFKFDANLVSYELKLQHAIKNYQDRGYKIAIDNFGNPSTLVSRLWQFKPDYVKFDMALIQESVRNDRVRSALFGLVNLARHLDIQPIITGVETREQLDIAIHSGTTLTQGYLLGKPSSAKKLKHSEVLSR